jgi:DedD protein
MDKSLQKKLVGAAVLIALAVIFLPMFLDGKKGVESAPMQIEIPPKTVYDIPNRLENQNQVPTGTEAAPSQSVTEMSPMEERVPTPSANQVPPPIDQTIEPFDEAPTTMEGTGEEDIAKTDPPVNKVPVEVQPKSEPSIDDVPVEVQPKSEPAKESKPISTSAAGFAVQVGSFGDQANAAELTDKLVASGFPAFLEDIDFRGRTIYRVKVGPQPARVDADELRQRLADNEGLEGIVVAHP